MNVRHSLGEELLFCSATKPKTSEGLTIIPPPGSSKSDTQKLFKESAKQYLAENYRPAAWRGKNASRADDKRWVEWTSWWYRKKVADESTSSIARSVFGSYERQQEIGDSIAKIDTLIRMIGYPDPSTAAALSGVFVIQQTIDYHEKVVHELRFPSLS